MTKFLLKRILSAIISFYLFVTILFFSVNWLIGGDFVDTLVLQLDVPGREALREELGLDLSTWDQYTLWLGQIMRGNLGHQFTIFGQGSSVGDLLEEALPATLLVFLTGSIVAFWIGQWLGQITAWRTSRWITSPTIITSIAAYTAFPPWLSFLLVYLLIDRWGLLTSRAGRGAWNHELWDGALVLPATIMLQIVYTIIGGLLVIALVRYTLQRRWGIHVPTWIWGVFTVALISGYWLFNGQRVFAWDVAVVAFMPLLTFTLLAFGDTLLIMRSSVIDTKYETYVQLARAKGLPEHAVRRHHAARNAILPALTRFVINLPYLLTAIVIVENATQWTGIGDLLFSSIYAQNTYVYMGIMVLVGLITLIARLGLEIVYVFLDPRIELQGGKVL